MRPAYEDLLGAGAVLSYLPGKRSPEAEAAVSVFESARFDLLTPLKNCSSGKQLIENGYEADVVSVSELNCDPVAPVLRNGAFVKAP